jgi:hypothetical protein
MESIKQPNLPLGAAEFVPPTRAAESEILCLHVRLRCDFHIICRFCTGISRWRWWANRFTIENDH